MGGARGRGAAGADPPRAAGGGRARVSAARPRDDAAAGLRALADRLEGAPAAGWGGDEGAAAALRALDPARDRIVSFVGKLIVSKGVDLLLAAWPLVVAAVPDARLCVVGFGEYRDGLERLLAAIEQGDLEARARSRGAAGRSRAARRASSATWPRSSTASRETSASAGWRPAPAAAARVHFTGRLEHSDLPDLLPACEAQVVPSTFPGGVRDGRGRGGGMRRAAALGGALRARRGHRGARGRRSTRTSAPLLEFERGPNAVREIAEKLVGWLTLDGARRASRVGGPVGAGARALRLGERGRGGDRRRARRARRPAAPRRSSVRAVLIGFPGLRPRGPQVAPVVSPRRSAGARRLRP